MQYTITLSLYLFSKLRVVLCQDASKMQEGVEKTLDFLVCFCDILPFVRKNKASLLGILQSGVTLIHFVTWVIHQSTTNVMD